MVVVVPPGAQACRPPELPPCLTLTSRERRNSVFVPNAGSGGAGPQRPDSKSLLYEEDTKKPQVMNLADLERSLFSIAK